MVKITPESRNIAPTQAQQILGFLLVRVGFGAKEIEKSPQSPSW